MSGSRRANILRIDVQASRHVEDAVAVEEPLEIRINGVAFSVIMRTPGADSELAAGFLFAEDVVRTSDELGTIEHCADVDEQGRQNTLNVHVTGDALTRLSDRLAETRHVTMTSSCGLCGRRAIESLRSRVSEVQGQWTISPDIIRSLPAALRGAQAVFASTGGLHAAGLFRHAGTLELIAEDVGRHNAVDKVIGRRLIEEALPLDRSILMVSGRVSYELVQKALLAGIPFVAAVSAPSSLAIDLAQQAGITLCGFVRGEAFNVYAHPERLA